MEYSTAFVSEVSCDDVVVDKVRSSSVSESSEDLVRRVQNLTDRICVDLSRPSSVDDISKLADWRSRVCTCDVYDGGCKSEYLCHYCSMFKPAPERLVKWRNCATCGCFYRVDDQCIPCRGRDREIEPQMVRAAIDHCTGIPSMTQSIGMSAASIAQSVDNLERSLMTRISEMKSTCKSYVIDLLLFLLDVAREVLYPCGLGIALLFAKFVKLFYLEQVQDLVFPHFTKLLAWFNSAHSQQTGEGEREIDAQGPLDFLDNVGMLVPLLGIIFLHKASPQAVLDKVIGVCKNANIVVPGVKNLWTLLDFLLQFIPVGARAWLAEACPAVFLTKIYGSDKIATWYEEVLRLQTICADGSFIYDPVVTQRIVQLHGEAGDFVNTVNIQNSPTLTVLLTDAYKSLTAIYLKVCEVHGTPGARKAPFSIYMYGGPGVGKSVFATKLAEYLTPEAVKGSSRIYSRTSGAKYFDGYACQHTVLLDDFGQDATGLDQMEYISMVGSVPFMPPLATLDNPQIGVKGTMFTSKLIIATSNIGWPKVKMINCADALYRRRHLLIKVSATGEARDENFSHLSFQLCNPLKPEVYEAVYNAVEIIQLIQQRQADFLANQEAIGGSTFSPAFMGRLVQPQNGDEIDGECDLQDAHYNANTLAVHANHHGIVDQSLFLEAWIRCGGSDTRLDAVTPVDGRVGRVKKALGFLQDSTKDFLDRHVWLRRGLKICQALGPSVFNTMVLTATVKITGVVCDKLFRGTTNPQSATNYNSPNESRGGRRRIPYADAFRAAEERMTPQGGTEVEPERDERREFSELIRRNMVELGFKQGVHNLYTTGFVIAGRTLLTTRHFWLGVTGLPEEHTPMWICYAGRKREFYFDSNALSYFPDPLPDRHRDLAVYILPRSIPQFKDRTSFFATSDRVDNLTGSRGFAVQLKKGEFQMTLIPEMSVSYEPGRYTVAGVPLGNCTTIAYPGCSFASGDCGSLLVSEKHPFKIVGMHIGTAKNPPIEGIAEVLTAHEVAFLKKRGLADTIERELISQGVDCVGAIVPEGDFDILGGLPKSLTPRLPQKTRWRESPLFDVEYQHTSEPCAFSDKDPRVKVPGSLFKRAIEKYARPGGPFREDHLRMCNDWLISKLSHGPQRYRRTFTLQEALDGFEGDPYVQRLCLQTSPGFGFKSPGQKGKFHLFDIRDGYDPPLKPIATLMQACERRVALAERGIIAPSLWTATIKDERLPILKIADGKVRVFSIPQVDMTVVTRQYFLGFFATMYHERHKFPGSAGMNCESSEWHSMVRYLQGVPEPGDGVAFFDLDYSRYDGVFPPEFHAAFGDLANAWYNDGAVNARVRRVIMEEMAFSNETALGTIYTKPGGMGSGWSGTLAGNSIGGIYYFFTAWMGLAPEHFRNAEAFEKMVRFKVMGDDNICGVSSLARDFFNPEAICAWLAQRGVTATSATKGTAATFGPLEEKTFLKRAFVINNDICFNWIPQLSKTSICEMVNWITDYTEDRWEALRTNAETALRFMFFHGRSAHDEMRSKLMKHERLGYFSTFDDKRVLFLTDHYGMGPLLEDVPCGERVVIPQSAITMDTVPQQENNVGMVMNTQTNMVTSGQNVSSFKTAMMSLKEPPLTLPSLALKDTLIGTVDWETTAAAGDVLSVVDVPSGLAGLWNVDRVFTTSGAFRSNFEFTVQVSGTKFHQGLVLVSWVPLNPYDPSYATPALPTLASLTFVDHVVIDASSSNAGRLTVPFIYPFPYMPTRDYSLNYGSLYISVFAPLAAATGAPTSIGISVSMRLIDAEFKIPSVPGVELIGPQTTYFRQIIPQSSVTPLATVEQGDAAILDPKSSTCESTSVENGIGCFDCLDAPMSVRDVLKRRTFHFQYTYNVDSSPGLTSGTIIGCFDAGGIWDPSSTNSMAGLWGPCFAMCRGGARYDLTFQMEAQGLSTPTFFAAFLPGVGLPNYPGNTGPIFGLPPLDRERLGSLILRNTRVASSGTQYCGFGMPALQVSSGMPAHISLEIPFVSASQAYLVPSTLYNSTTPTSPLNLNSSLTSPGIIVFGYTAPLTLLTNAKITVSCYGSVSDEFRFAGIRGLPIVKIGSTSIPPSTNLSALGIDNWESPWTPFVLKKRAKREADTEKSTLVKVLDKLTGVSMHVNAKTVDPKRHTVIGRNMTDRAIKPQGNRVSSSVTNYFSNVGSATLPNNVTGDAFDIKPDISGTMMDKPGYTMTGIPVYVDTHIRYPNSEGLEPVVKMCLDPSQVATATPAMFGTKQDEMSFQYLRGKMCYADRMAISSTDVAGDQIAVYPVGPMATAAIQNTVVGNSFEPTAMDLFSAPFSFWTGSIKYKLNFVASSMHSGRFLVCLAYGRGVPNDMNAAFSQYGFIVDLGEAQREFEFVVPFKSITTKLPVYNGQSDGLTYQPTPPDDATLLGSTYSVNYLNFVGSISIWVINPLVAPGGFPTAIDVLWSYGAGEDYTCDVLTLNNSSFNPLFPTSPPRPT